MSARSSKKRASPGADVEKNGDPLQDVELSDEDAKKLNDVQKEIQRVELILGSVIRSFPHLCGNANVNNLAERRAQQALTPVYQKRREVLKAINKFWPVALMNHAMFAVHAQHDADRIALSYLEDVWIVRDAREPKVFTLEFVRFTPFTPPVYQD
jgi:template-activating factor I